MSVELREFDMTKIRDDQIVVITGAQNTGKSFLTKDILFHHQDIPAGVVISPNENSQPFYQDFVPSVFIHDEYHPNITKKFMSRQKKLRLRRSNGEKDIDHRAFLIMESGFDNHNWKKDQNIRHIFLNGRSYKVMFILQANMTLPPMIRASVDWIFIFPTPLGKERKRLYEEYAGMFPTYEMFSKTMDHYCRDDKCLVIHNCSGSNLLEDQVFWYKANDHESFKACSPEAWQFDKDHSIQKEEEEEEDKDTNTDV